MPMPVASGRLVSAIAASVVVAAFACSLVSGTKDACNTDADCNPGRLCVSGLCTSADGSVDAGPAEASPAGDSASPFSYFQPAHPDGGVSLNAIWGTSDGKHVIIVGADTVSYLYDDGAWSRGTGNGTGKDFNAVFGFAANNVYAVGTDGDLGGFVQQWNGQAWETVFTCPEALFGVWGVSALAESEIYVQAVGYKGAYYGWYTGLSNWQNLGPLVADTLPGVPYSKDDPALFGISGRDVVNFAMAGGTDRVFVFNPTVTYDVLDLGAEQQTVLRTIWQEPTASTTSMYLGGSSFSLWWLSGPGFDAGVTSIDAAPPDAAAYNMTELSSDDSPGNADQYIRSVWGTASTVIGVGDQGRIYAYDVATTQVTLIPSPTTVTLRGVWGTSLSDIWIVGDEETVLRGSLAP